MACKEWGIVVPIVVLLYDLAFMSGDWTAIRSRSPYYAALFATWGVLLAGAPFPGGPLSGGGLHARRVASSTPPISRP
jgi:hypothetical protein